MSNAQTWISKHYTTKDAFACADYPCDAQDDPRTFGPGEARWIGDAPACPSCGHPMEEAKIDTASGDRDDRRHEARMMGIL